MRRLLKALGIALGVVATLLCCLLGWAYWSISNPDRMQPLELPEGLVSAHSARGKTLLVDASAADHAALTKAFQIQEKGTWCGVASAVSVLNARGTALTQDAFFSDAAVEVRPWLTTTFAGMPIGDLAGMIEAHGATVAVQYASDSDVTRFRDALKANTANPSDWLIVNYDRRALEEEGDGHISPVSAYAERGDMALVLDTAGYKYPFHWVPVTDLFKAMNTRDSESSRSRGWVVVN